MPFVLPRILVATLIAFVGVGFGVVLGRVSLRHLNMLVYAGVGALLAITVCDVLPDAKGVLSWPAFLAATVSGYALFWLIGKYVSPVCPACAITAFDEQTTQKLGQTALLLMVALGVHSAMDGMAIATGDAVAGRANLGVLFGVSFHKLPEGLALALLLIGAGYSRRSALLWSFAIEATTVLGGLLGMFALQGASLAWLGLLFGHVGGGFLYLVTSALGLFPAHGRRLPERSLMMVGGLTFLFTSLLLWVIGKYVK